MITYLHLWDHTHGAIQRVKGSDISMETLKNFIEIFSPYLTILVDFILVTAVFVIIGDALSDREYMKFKISIKHNTIVSICWICFGIGYMASLIFFGSLLIKLNIQYLNWLVDKYFYFYIISLAVLAIIVLVGLIIWLVYKLVNRIRMKDLIP